MTQGYGSFVLLDVLNYLSIGHMLGIVQRTLQEQA